MNIEDLAEAEIGNASSLEVSDEITEEEAELVAQWLINKYRARIIYSCIDEVFGSMTDAEREAVYRSVCDIISGRYSVEHLEYVKQKIINFFESYSSMNIDGFVRFRLKAYKAELRILVEECAADCLGVKDYKELLEIINFLFDITQI